MDNGNGKEKHDNTPWSLLITVLALLLTFFIVMPVMGFMYVDLNNLRTAMQVELKRVQDIRKQLHRERLRSE